MVIFIFLSNMDFLARKLVVRSMDEGQQLGSLVEIHINANMNWRRILLSMNVEMINRGKPGENKAADHSLC